MKRLILLTVFIAAAAGSNAQSYAETIRQYREKYKQEFLEDKHSPLKAEDTSFLRFFPPNHQMAVTAKFIATPYTKPFKMATHSGKTKMYRQYGVVEFGFGRVSNKNQLRKLCVYQSQDLMKDSAYKDYLFIPFNDMTNGTTTYGGGRYLDIKTSDIKDGRVTIDFNKCYNPYCAYASGYNCPIPPKENRLDVPVPAGEQKFGKETDE